MTIENEERHGFKKDFGTWTRTMEMGVYIVERPRKMSFSTYGVYVCHGHAGGAFWRNGPPLASFDTVEQARDFAERLYGIAGSGEYANMVRY